MTELERRALMGDKEAQEECARLGVVLPCAHCGSNAKIKYVSLETGLYGYTSETYMSSAPGFIKCNECGISTIQRNSVFQALTEWNTRPAPPVGRCGECANACDGGDNLVRCDIFDVDMMPDDFCSYFEPKGDEGNEAQSCKS